MNQNQKLRSLERDAGYVPPDHVGGATVLARLDIAGQAFRRGDKISADQLRSIGDKNLKAMIVNSLLRID
jgi:hypothetical protein